MNQERKKIGASNPFASMTPTERICAISRLNLSEYQKKVSKSGAIDKDSWLAGQIIASFEYLKERMKDLRISKETLAANGVDFAAYRNLYFAAL